MGKTTGISWTDTTYNPWQGCHKVSAGCKNCYMYGEKTRYGQDPATVVRSKPATFNAPLRWEKQAAATGEQRKVFTCSWSDFFIEEADIWRPCALLIMARTPHLTYQVLTKRPERIDALMQGWNESYSGALFPWPFPNVWLGVSVEDQATADERIPWLLKTPAAVRFVSAEPLLEHVNLDYYLGTLPEDEDGAPYPGEIDWIICGGESGPKARPCEVDWLRNTVKQCQQAGVACWMKQLGSNPAGWSGLSQVHDRKGADPAEWPEDMQVQQFPQALTLDLDV